MIILHFKEFSEYQNPEEADYDIKSSLKEEEKKSTAKLTNNNKYRKAFDELYFDLGCPEDFELEPFGITLKEFDNPTKETIEKLRKYAESLNEEKFYTRK